MANSIIYSMARQNAGAVDIRLLENQQYTATLVIGDFQHELSFTSKYSPLFSTVRIIRGDYRELFKSIPDNQINLLIRDNSILAMDIAAIEFTVEDEIPYFAKQYVRYKTELDLLSDLMLVASSTTGLTEKKLADFSFSQEKGNVFLQDTMKVANLRLASWEAQLTGGAGAASIGAVRAGAASAFPLTGRVF